MPVILTLYMCSSEDVRILSYFLNKKVVREEIRLGNIAISSLSVPSLKVQSIVRDSALRP